MNRYFKWALIALALASGIIISCQEELAAEDSSGALSPTSTLTDLLNVVAINPTDVATAIDSVACFNIKMPVEVVANGQAITVLNEAGYTAVEAVFNQSSLDADTIEYTFPITVIYPDYSEVMVGSQQQFNQLVTACNNMVDYMSNNCLALNYPVTVFAYNSSFQVQNTYDLTNNEELYTFLTGLEANEYYSVSYPVSIVANGQTITVNSNAEMETALSAAIEACNVVVPNPSGCQNPGVLTDDLVLYMPFSHNVADLMGSTVTAPADTTFVADRSGNTKCAIAFNGSQQLQVTSSAANSIVQGDMFSVSLWFKMQNTDNGNYEHLFRKGAQGQAGFNLSVYDMNTPLFGVPSGQVWDNNWNQDSTLWNDTTTWHHLVITYDANNTARLYRDGVLQNTETFSATIGAAALDYFIGQNFTGFLDDLRVYKKTLTQAEVQTLFELEGDCNTCLE